MLVRTVAAVVALVVALSTTPATAAPITHELFTLRDPRLTEVSGIAAGIASPGIDYVENDSGDTARFFALDGTSGNVLGEYHVPGAVNVDWEDLAIALDAQGVPSVWLADIGDNTSNRPEIDVYRVDEPKLRPGVTVGVQNTAAPQVWRLRYPDGPHNAESLAVTPTGVGFIITKEPSGVDGVYRLPSAPSSDDSVQTLTRIATFRVPTAIPLPGALLVTGASISADGTRLAVRTYLAAYVWQLTGGADPVATAFGWTPTTVGLPVQPVGEAVGFLGGNSTLIVASEQVGSAVYAVPLPTVALPTGGGGAVDTSSRPVGDHSMAAWLILAGALALALAVGLALRRRRS